MAKKGKNRAKKDKMFENLGKNVQNLKIFLTSDASCYCKQETA